jgi:hypothetical protein
VPENNGKVRPMTKLEMKRLLSAKLRDPNTSTKDFVAMLPTIKKLNPGWNRRRPAKGEPSVDDLVQQLELKKKQRHAKPM